METVLSIIAVAMADLGIQYEYERFNGTGYPYWTGTYTGIDFSAENNRESGQMLLEGWTRERNLPLVRHADQIKKKFRNYQTAGANSSTVVNFLSAITIPTGEADLKKIQIVLQTEHWEGI